MTAQLVWDMDGTLLDSTAIVLTPSSTPCENLEDPPNSRREVVDAYSRGVPEAILAHLLQRRVTDEEAEVYYGHLSAPSVDP